MSTRSDVGVAITATLLTKIRGKGPKVIKFLEEESDEKLVHKQGVLFLFRDYKWLRLHPFSQIDALYNALEVQSPCGSDYLIVEACHDYPVQDDATGEWLDNPWRLHQELAVSVYYEES